MTRSRRSTRVRRASIPVLVAASAGALLVAIVGDAGAITGASISPTTLSSNGQEFSVTFSGKDVGTPTNPTPNLIVQECIADDTKPGFDTEIDCSPLSLVNYSNVGASGTITYGGDPSNPTAPFVGTDPNNGEWSVCDPASGVTNYQSGFFRLADFPSDQGDDFFIPFSCDLVPPTTTTSTTTSTTLPPTTTTSTTLPPTTTTSTTLPPTTTTSTTLPPTTTTSTTLPPTTTTSTTLPPTTTTSTTLPPTTTTSTTLPPTGPTCGGLAVTILGTSGADRLLGTDGPDVIEGLGGDDRIAGLDGDDVICGGGGNDLIEAGAGHDTVHGGAGDDRIVGSSGRDDLRGADGMDSLVGGSGDDRLHGGPDSDACIGGAGTNTYASCEAPLAPAAPVPTSPFGSSLTLRAPGL